MEKKKVLFQFFSAETNKFYQLLQTETVPVLRISGVPMQRFIHVDPLRDAKLKIEAVKPKGIVLDVGTGLGYTAIECAKLRKVKKVITIEKDRNVLRMARLNYASNKLFSEKKIKIIVGDAKEKVKEFRENFFDCIINDPPTFKLAPELYSLDFYSELYRVLKKGGRLWHYSPMPGKAKDVKKSERFAKKIMNNLKKVGFKKLKYNKESSGILAIK